MAKIEARIHQRQHDTEARDDPALAIVQPPVIAPWPPPQGEDRPGARDPEPGDAERGQMGEEKHREGRAQIVEDRADEEIDMGRQAVGQRRGRGT